MKLLRRNPSLPESAAPAVPDPGATVTRRRVEVTVEREWARVLDSKTATQLTSFEADCEACGARVLMIAPATAARMAGVTIRTIYRWVDEQKLHFVESSAGELYLCAQSIPAPHQPHPLSNKTLPPGDSR